MCGTDEVGGTADDIVRQSHIEPHKELLRFTTDTLPCRGNVTECQFVFVFLKVASSLMDGLTFKEPG
ncbi:hypothetical protein AOXY_G19849 [Acipenser oxyrinchus oxyrinchus]|uniref:Uncharacterized protein n=1 Tax=Acipenser oxyrinchus oxyrinchus TaxID=40147 RepID=A0AAD8D2D4_ACIOX|nr:hypothetical protein AOXY_G19849 [Acipenser oxyrinchus oxyrinchus]